jgi:hypothetical protein
MFRGMVDCDLSESTSGDYEAVLTVKGAAGDRRLMPAITNVPADEVEVFMHAVEWVMKAMGSWPYAIDYDPFHSIAEDVPGGREPGTRAVLEYRVPVDAVVDLGLRRVVEVRIVADCIERVDSGFDFDAETGKATLTPEDLAAAEEIAADEDGPGWPAWKM